MYMKGELICFHKETNYPIKLRSLNVHSLFYAPVGIRGVLGDGYPSEVNLYILRSNCTKFGAFVHSVPILMLSNLTIKKRNIIFECTKFNQCKQEEGESVDDFVTALHCLSCNKNFGPPLKPVPPD